MYRNAIYLVAAGRTGDNCIVMSTYGYSIRRHCGGSGKADQGDCGHCQGAGLTSRLLDEHTTVKPARPLPSLMQARTTEFHIPRHAE